MLHITIPAMDQEWDEINEVFVTIPETHLQLEHSLISISKWESKFHKAFISDKEKTKEELLYYIECMTITQSVDEEVYKYIPEEELKKIQDYIEDDHTAVCFCGLDLDGNPKPGTKKEVITSEVIYYYMVALNIPFECQKWHLGRLMTLIKVCNEKNKEAEDRAAGKKKKRLTIKEQNDLARQYDRINEERKRQLGVTG